ncbi:sensor histidine kinase [Sutcliffiella deserti]|uniref:sensor histidine kinase n=1 Tax=Sutcliffiella deserti TaxID=2875501 RepID=UPI001CBB64E3|nr:HAMP domain-containing sensor histidine kinase [Sutcliffiella deserti]
MKFSTKLGLWFFFCILIIETGSMLFLHQNVVQTLIDNEKEALLARGASHRDVLEDSFTDNTLQHIVLMESKTDTEVVITDQNGDVIESSIALNEEINFFILQITNDDQVIEADWESQSYIATASPFRSNSGENGTVYMLKSTNQMKGLITDLNHHFAIAVIIILFFLVITNIILVKLLTKPLVSMKEATKRISEGDFTVTLPVKSKDEIGELANSIQTLASNLNYLKQERKEFLASISHELRTPLTYIRGYADIGQKPNLVESQKNEYLKIIHEESIRVSNLLEDLFELAKMDQNSFSIMNEEVQFREFLQTIYDKAYPVFSNSGIELKFNRKEECYVNIDPLRFEQVVLNILDNALKYSDGGTTTIELSKKDNTCKLTISDEGKGIPEDQIPYIFDRLFRVEKSRSRLTGGVGLGLSIVKEIVDAHEGELKVSSEFGVGTTVSILLKEAKNR